MTDLRLFDPNIISANVQELFGDEVRDELHMYLGNPATGEIVVPMELADHPSMVYVHGVSVQNLILTDNEDDATDDKQFLTSALLTPEKINPGLLIFGTPVKVKLSNGIFKITELDDIPAAEYLFGLKERLQRSVDISQFDYGLLRPSDPPSLKAIVTTARYVLEDEAYFVPTLETIDFTSEVPNISSGLGKAVLIQLDPITNSLDYTYGGTFDNNEQHYLVFSNYPNVIDPDKFVIGWIKLYTGMTKIQIADILPSQEILNKSAASIVGIVPAIVTAGGDPVVSDGDLVWS